METESRVDVLVDRWEEMRDAGTPPTIEALCAGCPELVAEVRCRVEALQAMDLALEISINEPRSATGDGERPGAGLECGLPEVLRATAVYFPRGHHGHGGLGVVLTAHQEELDRTVALKRIRPDKLHDLARRRFLREAAITARLQHPGIVPIYGLGQDDDGPFYTMPLIDGQTLEVALDAFHHDDSLRRDPGGHDLRFRGLLQQFIAVCNTVAYAHDQGVVHRDLKPSNLMLGAYGETLVMDWGLAKRFGADTTAAGEEGDSELASSSPAEVTATGEVLGTPRYMSPEQARGEPAGPSGDIFSLGLVLYAILTGKSAFEEWSFLGPDRLKAVREAAIVPPRRRDPGLSRALEAICLKALSARALDRYTTARDLAVDVTRWLADEPVTAWREPVSSRARRWARRHRTAVAAAVVALAAGVIGLGAVAAVQVRANARLAKAGDETARALESTRQAQARTQAALEQSEESRKQADAVSRFLVEAFRSPDPSVDGREMKVVDVLDRAVSRLDHEFAGSEATRAALFQALGTTYLGLSAYDRAVSVLGKARTLREAALGLNHPDTLGSRSNLAIAYRAAGRLADAIAMDEGTLERRAAALEPDDPETLASRNNLAICYEIAGRLPDAIAMHEVTLKLLEAKLGQEHLDTLSCANNLANAYRAAGRLAEAIAMHAVTVKRLESKLGSDHPATLMSRNNLAAAYVDAGRPAEAIALHKTTFELSRTRLGSRHADTLMSRNNLADAYLEAGRVPEAIALLEETIPLYESELGPDNLGTLMSRKNLANAYQKVGRLAEAIVMQEATLGFRVSKQGPDHPDTLTSRNDLANSYLQAGRISEAIAMHEAASKLAEPRLGADHPTTLMSRINLAIAYAAAGRTLEAIALHAATLGLLNSKLGPDHPYTLANLHGLAAANEQLGRWEEAERLDRDVLARRRNFVRPDDPRLVPDLTALSQCLLGQSRWSEAEPLLRECLAIREQATPEDWRRYHAMSLLGQALLGQGRQAEAEPMIVRGYEGMQGRESQIPILDRPRLREAAGRTIQLYEGWGRPAQASVWKARSGMLDLPANVFARPFLAVR